jgi:hypothetical protein
LLVSAIQLNPLQIIGLDQIHRPGGSLAVIPSKPDLIPAALSGYRIRPQRNPIANG